LAENSVASAKAVDFADIASALAKAMADGDIVNFRLLFLPLSPGRASSNETFDMPKYAYLLPDEDEEKDPEYKRCLAAVMAPRARSFVEGELAANRPPQLPSDLVLMLADNAVRTGKYSTAAQAYELLRVRDRMRLEFLKQADAALDVGDIATAVKGYIIGTGLAYDYSAFPEPLPLVPDFQTRALMLHAEYPQEMANCIGIMDPRLLLQTALAYLLLEPETAARLDGRSEETRVDFVRELVMQQNASWPRFVERYQEAAALVQEFGARLEQAKNAAMTLADEIQALLGADPRRIPAALLGREIDDGQWWQYLKELAGEHPAAVLFVARQQVGDIEILVPRHRADSPLAQSLGIQPS
jgi:hypothetical protein